MTLLSFLIAFGHFTSELMVFGTAKLNVPVASPVIVSSEPPSTAFRYLY